MLDIKVHPDNIHVEDSYLVESRKVISKVIKDLRLAYPDHTVMLHRTDCSLVSEWVAHNRLYKLGIERERTRSVDLDWPQSLKYRIAYAILGI